MYSILQETTKWAGDYNHCNHTYLLDNDKIIAYVKYGDNQVNQLKSRMRIDKRYRTFIKVDNSALSELIPKNKNNNIRIFKVKSKDKEYMVELIDNSKYTCTCTGFTFRGKCKHITAVAEKQQQAK
jgi:hypothetical protein